MFETFAALLFAHVLTDVVLQTNWMAARKHHPGVLLLHGVLVLLTAQIALGQFTAWPLLVLALAHLMIDAVKTYGGFDSLTGFLTDQAAHLLSLLAVSLLIPTLWHGGFWANWPKIAPYLPALMALVAGALLATRAGGFATGLLMRGHAVSDDPEDQGLPGGGATIGHLERGLIYLLVLSGNLSGIGFLVAAKSILRFGTVSGDRKATEYVIIGTLFSFGWALIVALLVQKLLIVLPPLEIAPKPT